MLKATTRHFFITWSRLMTLLTRQDWEVLSKEKKARALSSRLLEISNTHCCLPSDQQGNRLECQHLNLWWLPKHCQLKRLSSFNYSLLKSFQELKMTRSSWMGCWKRLATYWHISKQEVIGKVISFSSLLSDSSKIQILIIQMTWERRRSQFAWL